MNKQLAILFTGILAAHAIALVPVIAQTPPQTEGKFYCGSSYDPLSKKNIPTTLKSHPKREEPLTIILWKSEYFGEKYSPQQRCNIVSPKFQAAYTAGNLEYMVADKDPKSGQPIVCATKTAAESCNSSNMLFTLKPYTDDKTVRLQLMEIIETSVAASGIYQSSSGRTVVKLPASFKSGK